MHIPPEPEPLPPRLFTLRLCLRVVAWLVVVAVALITLGGEVMSLEEEINRQLGGWVLPLRLLGIVAAAFLLIDSALRRRDAGL